MLLVFSISFLILVSGGVAFFFIREQRVPSIAHELSIKARSSSQHIIKNQFLIFVPVVPRDFKNILDNLDLEISMPLLNWVLVTKKNQNNPIIALDDPAVEEDRLILNSLREHPHILDAQHNFALDSALVPTNKSFEKEWHLENISMPQAWDLTQGTKDTRIAIIDEFLIDNTFTFYNRFKECDISRVNFLRPYAQEYINDERSSIPHGEIMLLALGACAQSQSFSSGINWHAELLAIQRPSKGQAQSFLAALYAAGIDVCKESSTSCPKNIINQQSLRRAHIILLPFAHHAPDILQFSSDMIKAIRKYNIFVITAAGNNNQNASSFFPGAAPDVINVGALTKEAKRASFSNWGNSIDIFAPGDAINFFYPSGHKRAQGTSVAAAYTAGTLSLMLALNPNLSQAQARFILKNSSSKLSCDNYCLDYEPCSTQCCSLLNNCAPFALNAYEALRQTRDKYINSSVLSASNYYLVFSRAHSEAQEVIIYNEGDKAASIQVVSSNIIKTSEDNFILEAHKSKNIYISFYKEPFTRAMHNIKFMSQENILDIYLEYIPKN
jgi:hypothetical protein